jgi:ribonuclease HII
VRVGASAGSWALQAALERRGLSPVAGVDEAGHGACAGPLVVAACVLRKRDGRWLEGLTDSKLLTAPARERIAERVRERAVDFAVVEIPPADVDRLGVRVADLEGMRRAVARLTAQPGYVLTDGFPVPGLTAPSIGVIKGDLAAACVAAASVLAKVARDHVMVDLHETYPNYRFDAHKGYCTALHAERLAEFGPCGVHRFTYANVQAAACGEWVSADAEEAYPDEV